VHARKLGDLMMSKTNKAVVSMNCVFPIMRSVATGRSKRRWEYNIKMDLEGTRCDDSDSILLDSDSKKVADSCEHDSEP
jgi:hypothetical protein